MKMEQSVGKSIKFGPITGHVSENNGWFRFFKRGFYYKDTEKVSLSFSERNKYKKTLRLGKWLLGPLYK